MGGGVHHGVLKVELQVKEGYSYSRAIGILGLIGLGVHVAKFINEREDPYAI